MALADLFGETADAIRERDGTTAKIVANSFPPRIRGIPALDPQYLYGPYDVDPVVLIGSLVLANIKSIVRCGENYQNIDPAKRGVLCSENYEILDYGGSEENAD